MRLQTASSLLRDAFVTEEDDILLTIFKLLLSGKSFSAEEESFAQGGRELEIKNRVLNRFNSTGELP